MSWRPRATALLALAIMAAGCSADDGGKRPISAGRALTPQNVDQYARQRGISTQQAQQELRQQVSDYDAEKALADASQNGVIQR